MDLTSPLDFSSADLRLGTPGEVAKQMRVAPAFIQLCLDSGMPTRAGALSAASVFEWLMADFPEVRRLAGLPALSFPEGLDQSALSKVPQAAAVLTVVEYCMSRSSDAGYKESLLETCSAIRKALGIV